MRRSGCGVAIVLATLFAAPSAHAVPVTITFESGAEPNAIVDTQYGPPNVPAGPAFKTGASASFTGLNCGPGTIDAQDTAYSGSRTLILNGCPGLESRPTALFFAMGYSTHSVHFQVAVQGSYSSCPNYICAEIWSTAFRADGSIVAQQQTLLPPQQGPTYKEVPLDSATDEIAFVAIERGARDYQSGSATGVTLAPGFGGPYLLVDDLTYDPPSSPPASSFRIGTDRTSVRVAEGQQAPLVKIPVTWTNNPNASSSPVALELSAPVGITGTFVPNPTTSGTSTLTLQVAKDAPLGVSTVTIDGYVDKGTVSEKHAQTTLPVDVVAPFVISPIGNYTGVPCATRDIAIHVATDQSFTDPVDVNVSLNGQTGTTFQSVMPGSLFGKTYAYGTLTNDNRTMIVRIAVAAGTPASQPQTIDVTAGASGYGVQKETGTFSVVPGTIAAVDLAGTNIPVTNALTQVIPGGFMRAPTKVDVHGSGFCAGSLVEFGATGGGVTPTTLAADGTSLSVTVPRTAIDGPLRVIPGGGGAPIVASPALRADNFRARWGLQFANFGAPNNFTFKQFEDVFGYAAMHLSVDLCAGFSFGLAHCPAPTPIPDPVAVIVKVALEGRGKIGLCYGFSRTVGQFAFGAPFNGFAPGNAATPNGLDKPATFVPGNLLDRIEENHIQQWDANVLNAWAIAHASVSGTPADHAAQLRKRVLDEFAAKANPTPGGQPPLIAMQTEDGGHAVLAYDLEDLGGGKFQIHVLDPNVPFTPAEAGDGTHAARQTMSTIVIDPATDKWTFANLTKKAGGPWDGPLDGKSLWVAPLAVTYDSTPRLPGLTDLPFLVTLASDGARLTGVSDPKGKPVPGAIALPPTDAAEGDNPIEMLPRTGAYTVTATQGGRLSAIGSGFAATATTGAAKGRAAAAVPDDRLGVDGATHAVRLMPGASAPIDLALAARGGGATRTVALTGRGHAGASDGVRIGAHGVITITHSGPAAARTLTLSSATTTVTRKLKLTRDGLTLRVDWKHLARSGRVARAHLIKSARLRAKRVLTVRFTRARGARWATGGVTFLVARGRRVVAHATEGLTAQQLAGGRAVVTWTPRKLAKGRYRAIAVASVSAIGADGVARSATRVRRAGQRGGGGVRGRSPAPGRGGRGCRGWGGDDPARPRAPRPDRRGRRPTPTSST